MSHDSTSPPASSRADVIGRGITWVSRWSLRWVLIAAGAVLLGLMIQYLWGILLPIVLALILTTVLQTPARMLERRLHFPAALAAATVVVGAIGVVVLAIAVLAPSVTSQAGDIAESASTGLTKIQDLLVDSGLEVTEAQISAFVQAAQDRLQSSASTIATGVLTGVGAVTSALITVLLVLVLSFFFLKDGRRFLPWVERVAGPGVGTHLSTVAGRAYGALGGFVRTQALVGLIDAVLIGAGLLIVGVPLAVPLAILTFVGAFAPIIGAVTVGALAVLVALVSNGWVAALIILVLVLVVQQLEGNVLLPVLQGKSLDLHAAVVLLTVVLGSGLFGVAGAFLSVPVVAVTAVVLRYLGELVDARAPAAVAGADAGPGAEAEAAPVEKSDD